MPKGVKFALVTSVLSIWLIKQPRYYRAATNAGRIFDDMKPRITRKPKQTKAVVQLKDIRPKQSPSGGATGKQQYLEVKLENTYVSSY